MVCTSPPTMALPGRKSRPSQVSVRKFQVSIDSQVLKRFPGTYVADPTDTTGYNNDIMGLAWVTFDSTSGSNGTATPRIFVGVANKGSDNVFVSNDAGSTCKRMFGLVSTQLLNVHNRDCRRWSKQHFPASQRCPFGCREVSLHLVLRRFRPL